MKKQVFLNLKTTICHYKIVTLKKIIKATILRVNYQLKILQYYGVYNQTRLQLVNPMILLGVSIKTCEQSRMTRHLLFAVLMNASGKLSNIASRGNQTIKFFNNLLNNFLQVVKLNEGFVGDISKHSTMSSFNSPNHNRFIV